MDTVAGARQSDAADIELSLQHPDHFADRYASQIHRYAARRLGPAAADDIVADVFLIAFRRRDRYNTERASARPWLYGIATNLISRHRRSEVRTFRALARTGVDPIAESHADRVAAEASAAAAGRQLAAALAKLSDGDRHVLLLFAWADLRYEEIAAALDIPVGTVRSRLHRAQATVRTALGNTNPLDTDEEMNR
ncbi:MAG: sigma-70 family RNA polymerase sigma factor [Sporichthyaceae bacterium]|nr:sigma-70 family RNA polymerase sigma factor [Sporichthyaceae bacterium]